MSSVANDADDLGDLSSDYESEEDELAEMKPLKVIKRTRRRTGTLFHAVAIGRFADHLFPRVSTTALYSHQCPLIQPAGFRCQQ